MKKLVFSLLVSVLLGLGCWGDSTLQIDLTQSGTWPASGAPGTVQYYGTGGIAGASGLTYEAGTGITYAATLETPNLLDSTEYTTYSPTWDGITIGNATVEAKYKRIGKVVHVVARIVVGSSTSWTGSPSISVPLPADTSSGSGSFSSTYLPYGGAIYKHSTSYYAGTVNYSDATYANLRCFAISGATYEASVLIGGSAPFAWTTGDVMVLDFWYETSN